MAHANVPEAKGLVDEAEGEFPNESVSIEG
jgi:hypothetical protein